MRCQVANCRLGVPLCRTLFACFSCRCLSVCASLADGVALPAAAAALLLQDFTPRIHISPADFAVITNNGAMCDERGQLGLREFEVRIAPQCQIRCRLKRRIGSLWHMMRAEGRKSASAGLNRTSTRRL